MKYCIGQRLVIFCRKAGICFGVALGHSRVHGPDTQLIKSTAAAFKKIRDSRIKLLPKA